MTFKQYFTETSFISLVERVSPDCSTGAGEITTVGPWQGYKVVRTKHLDEPRNPSSEIQRDDGFDCDTFDKIITKLIQKRPTWLKIW